MDSSKKSYLLRLDREIMEHLESWADEECRSINGQIEWIIRKALKKKKGHRSGAKS